MKILDLGLVRLTEPPAGISPLTPIGLVVGTPDYVAPEQIDDPRQADIRSDVYSLGCTFYFLLTGAPPFPAAAVIQKLDAHRWEKPTPLHEHRPEVSESLSALVARMLAKRPDDRPGSPMDLIAALDGICEQPASAKPPAFVRTDVVVESPLPGRRIGERASAITGLCLVGGGSQVIVADQSGTIAIWDTATGQMVRRLTQHETGVLALASSPDGRTVLSADQDGTVWVWKLGRKQLRALTRHSGAVRCLAVLPDGQAALSGGDDQGILRWNLRTCKCRRVGGMVAERHWGPVLALAISADGSLALSGSADRTMRLWDLRTGHELRCFRGHLAPVSAIALAPDGRTALSAAGSQVQQWDITAGERLHSYEGHEQSVRSLAISPDGRLLVVASEDGTVRLWETNSGQLRHTYRSQTACVCVSPDGGTLIAGGTDGSVRIWPVG